MKIIQKKVCMLGEISVGKTSLVRRFVEGRFDEDYLSTIGVTIYRKSILREDHQLNLLIWDLAGGEKFTKTQSSYLRGAAGALIVCDLTRRETLGCMSTYTQKLRTINSDAQIVYLYNKVDLGDQREISDSEIQAVFAELGGPYLLTSAKTGDKVEDAFCQLAELIASKT